MQVVFVTSDNYSDILVVTHHFLERFWKDCPYHVELVAERFACTHFDNITYSGKGAWSDVIRNYVVKLDENDLVLLMLDDYILSGPVRTDLVKRYESIMEGNPNIAYIRLIPCPGPDNDSEWDDLGEFDRSQGYLISLQATIWRVKDMLNLLIPGTDPWKVELEGSTRFRHYPARFLGVKEYRAITYQNMVDRGKVNPKVQEWVERMING